MESISVSDDDDDDDNVVCSEDPPITSKIKRNKKQFILRIKLNINRHFQANYSPCIFPMVQSLL